MSSPAAELHEAFKTGNVEKARELIEADPSLLHGGKGIKTTPLHLAALNGHKAMAEMLIAGDQCRDELIRP